MEWSSDDDSDDEADDDAEARMAATRELIRQADAEEGTPDEEHRLIAEKAEADLVVAMMSQSADTWGFSADKAQVS